MVFAQTQQGVYMFTFLNVYNKNSITVKISYINSHLDFDVSTLISKRNKEELDAANQYVLLNAYLKHKGPEFQAKLMERYREADEVLVQFISRNDINPLPYSIVHNILDMFDLKEVTDYVRDVYGIKPPKVLARSFDKQKETDGDGTRAQTYLVEDYMELAALSVILKTVLPVIGQFGYLKSGYINGQHKEYILFNFISTHPIYKTAPMVKLYEFTDKLVKISFKSSETVAIRIIEQRIPKEEMTKYILASVVFSKISVASIVDDYDGKNVITRMHSYIQNKLNARRDIGNAIRNKNALMDESNF